MEVYYQQLHHNKITNRPCEAVGVEEINGLVQNAKGLVVRNAKWFVVRMRMLHQGDISINHKYG